MKSQCGTRVVIRHVRPVLKIMTGALLALSATVAQSTVVVGTTFEGTSQLDNCALGQCFRPPDTMGAAGTTQYLETTNGSITVYDKATGFVQSRVSMPTFWASAGLPGGAGGDQRVLFDMYTNRWIMTGFGATGNIINIAVSDTANAMGTWKSTQIIGSPTSRTLDYPTLGMDNKGVYIGTNNFAPGFTGTSLFSIPKADLFGGAPTVANMTRFDTPYPGVLDRGFAIQGAVNWGGNPTNTANIATVSRDQFDVFTYKVNGVNAAGATQTAVNELNVAPYTFNGAGRQPDGTRLVDTLDDRISANVYEANGKLYFVQTVTPPGGQFTELRWYVVNAATGMLIDTGTIGGGGYDYYEGSIAVNEFGRAVIGYNRSGSSTADANGDGKADGRISFFAQALVTDGGGGLDAIGSAILLRVSDISDYRCGNHNVIDTTCRQRWGDYSAVTIDPLDHNNFWAIGEYAASWSFLPPPNQTLERAIWHTYIAEITVVPEPETYALMLLGLVMAGIARRRARK